jgi:hypothetical protein
MSYSKVPSKVVLEQWSAEGLTQQQMADRIREDTGVPVSRAAISLAMTRYGMEPRNDRHDELIPWRVKTEHLLAWEVRLLRREARRRKGKPLKPRDESALDGWLASMHEQKAVVAYYPDSPHGFYCVPAEPEDYEGLAPGEHPLIRRPKKPAVQ